MELDAMKRRSVLLGLGTAAAGSGVVFGSGAFTQVQAERSVTIGIDQDSNALLALQSNGNIASVQNGDNGELYIDTDELSGDNEGFNVGAEVQIGETKSTGFPEPEEAVAVPGFDSGTSNVSGTGAAFKLTNNFGTVAGDDDDSNEIDIGINLEDLDDTESNLTFIGSEYDSAGDGETTNNGTLRIRDGGQAIFNGVPSGNRIYFVIHVETTSDTDPADIDGEVTFRAGPNLAEEYPTDAAADGDIVNVTQDTIISTGSIQDAVSEGGGNATNYDGASEGDLIQVPAGEYNESINISVDEITIEGPNAGIPYNYNRGDEAKIRPPKNKDAFQIGADGVKINGFDIKINATSMGTQALYPNSAGNDVSGAITIINNIVSAEGDVDEGINGVFAPDSDGGPGTPDSLIIRGNEFDLTGAGNGNSGINIVGSSTDREKVTISNNKVVSDPGQVRDTNEVTIKDNEFVIDDPEDLTYGTSLDLRGSIGSGEITGNTFNRGGGTLDGDTVIHDESGTFTLSYVLDNNEFEDGAEKQENKNKIDFENSNNSS